MHKDRAAERRRGESSPDAEYALCNREEVDNQTFHYFSTNREKNIGAFALFSRFQQTFQVYEVINLRLNKNQENQEKGTFVLQKRSFPARISVQLNQKVKFFS